MDSDSCFLAAAARGDTAAMSLLLSNTSDPAGMLYGKLSKKEVPDYAEGPSWFVNARSFPVVEAARGGYVDAVNLLLDHPQADVYTMLRQRCDFGFTAFLAAAQASEYNGGQFCNCQSSCGHTDVMRVLLRHPSADPDAMLADTTPCSPAGEEWGWSDCNVLALAASAGHVAVMRLVLDHPSSDVEHMLTHVSRDGAYPGGQTALGASAYFASGDGSEEHASCTPMLLLLRHKAAQKLFRVGTGKAAAADRDVIEFMHTLLTVDVPVVGRDECVRLLIELGSPLSGGRPGKEYPGPVMIRIIRELARERAELVRMPHLMHEAIVGLAFASRVV